MPLTRLPSQQLAERYQLNLTGTWRNWFDRQAEELELPGALSHPLPVSDLLADAPMQIWAGFMLPDTIPLLGNGYGDWICARITASSEIGELIYWYHGGGDWIPVGTQVGEAILHDSVDQFREIRKQTLRGASESKIGTEANCIARLATPKLLSFLARNLCANTEKSEDQVRRRLDELVDDLAREDYLAGLQHLKAEGWAVEAVACDLVDTLLQLPQRTLATSAIADETKIDWFPDYVRILFDSTHATPSQTERILAASDLSELPLQSWGDASVIAASVLERRHDLGWAANIAGWNFERDGKPAQAAACYWRGLKASSFTDQSVRFNSHAIADDSKFTATRLLDLCEHLSPAQAEDAYLQAFSTDRETSPLSQVNRYWMKRGADLADQGKLDAAYDAFLLAGWDLGVSRLAEYQTILSTLAETAEQAGAQARAEVARTHLRCLEARMK